MTTRATLFCTGKRKRRETAIHGHDSSLRLRLKIVHYALQVADHNLTDCKIGKWPYLHKIKSYFKHMARRRLSFTLVRLCWLSIFLRTLCGTECAIVACRKIVTNCFNIYYFFSDLCLYMFKYVKLVYIV